MLKKFLVICFVLALSIIHIYAQDDEEKIPVKWTLKTDKPSKPLSKDDIFKVQLSAEIEKGWHLYALEKIEGGPIPTRISLAEEQPFELGKIEAPKPIEVDDSAFGVTTKFYENSVNFILPVKVLDTFDSENTELKVKVRFQICTDQMCLPPKTVMVASGFK